MSPKNKKLILFSIAGAMTLSIITLALWTLHLQSEIDSRLKNGWFHPPVEIYSAHQVFRVGIQLSPVKLESFFKKRGYRERGIQQSLLKKDWVRLSAPSCLASYSFITLDLSEVATCFAFRFSAEKQDSRLLIIGISPLDEVLFLVDPSTQEPVEKAEFPPKIFAQYSDKKPVLRRVIQVGQAPLQCLQAITAIEDSSFLEHKGVSITGTLRAVLRNIMKRRFAEGGSTITQQLVKNYFLTGEKTIKRKVTEQIMAVLLDAQYSKDEILENYLNVIYMGANGPFQVRGFAAASDHYLQKPLEILNLSECALLAALVNSPGRYNPFTKTENSLKRRNRVLEKMHELQMIDEETAKAASEHPLPGRPPRLLSEPAPYFIQAVNERIEELDIDTKSGLKIYTTLNIEAQELAQTIVSKQVKATEDWYASIKKIKDSGKDLQASLLSVDIATGQVLALVGGRSFRQTQYNRITESRRQVGSVMKPFVYLAALESLDEEGNPYSPTTLIPDTPFTHEYEGQTWSPRNYNGKFNGQVPLFYALKSSLNSATAQLGLKVGLGSIVDIARRLGIESRIEPLPSLSLGSFELTPWEVTRAYNSIANFGTHRPLSLIQKITTLDDELIYQPVGTSEAVLAPENVAALIGMLKHTLLSGTARASKKMGFEGIAAGKTGTTSDTKDAWFVGFTPHVLTTVWMGYDDNTPMGLTGASGALPIWANYMKEVNNQYPQKDFTWPEGSYPVRLRAHEVNQWLPPQDAATEDVELILRSSDETFD